MPPCLLSGKWSIEISEDKSRLSNDTGGWFSCVPTVLVRLETIRVILVPKGTNPPPAVLGSAAEAFIMKK